MGYPVIPAGNTINSRKHILNHRYFSLGKKKVVPDDRGSQSRYTGPLQIPYPFFYVLLGCPLIPEAGGEKGPYLIFRQMADKEACDLKGYRIIMHV